MYYSKWYGGINKWYGGINKWYGGINKWYGGINMETPVLVRSLKLSMVRPGEDLDG